MARSSLLKETYDYLRARKEWWLAPILVFLVLLSIFSIWMTQSAWITPVIYPLF